MKTNRKLLKILLDLHSKSRSGILRIRKDASAKQLLLTDGLLVSAESNVPQEHLAWIMVQLNLLPRAQLNEISASMKAGKTSEEAILALSGFSLQNLENGRREQAAAIVASMLAWSDFDARFYSGKDLVAHRVNLGMTMPELIAVSTRHAISKRLLTPPPHLSDGILGTAGNGFEVEFPLNQAEAYAFSLLESPMKAEDLRGLLPDSFSRPEDVLLSLYSLGLISLKTPKSPGAPDGISEEGDAEAPTRKLEDLLYQFKSASFYEILSVGVDASQQDIQASYHEKAKHLHPDRFQTAEFSAETRATAEQVFARINQAYLTLKNPDSRASYDEQQAKEKAGRPGPKPGTAQSAEMAEALCREGRNLLARGDLETALERLKGCVWLCPENAAYNHHLGVAESRFPHLRKSAESHLLKAIELEDTSIDSHLALGKLYIEVNLPRKAEVHLQHVLSWDRENAEARNLLSGLKKARTAH